MARAGALAGAAASASSSSRGTPCETLSPTLTFTDFTRPASDDGISIDALSDSTVISDCSSATRSPAFTSTSITSTSLNSPMSGTFTSIVAIATLPREHPPQAWCGLVLAGSIRYLRSASDTFFAGIAPSSASDLSAASATKWRSTSKCSRSR